MSDEEQTPSTILSFNDEISVSSNTSVSEGNYHSLSFCYRSLSSRIGLFTNVNFFLLYPHSLSFINTFQKLTI